MERCPNCRARWESGETCRRCGMDLGPLLGVERAVEALLLRAAAQLAAGETEAASRSLGRASDLSADPLVGHLRRFVRTLTSHPRQPGLERSLVEPSPGQRAPE